MFGHHLRTTFHLGRYCYFCILSNFCRTGNKSARYRFQRSIGHGSTDTVTGYTRNRDADWVIVSCIKYIHQCCRYRCRRFNHGILLRKITTKHLSICLFQFHIAIKCIVTNRIAYSFIHTRFTVERLTTYIYIRTLSRVNSCQNDAGTKLTAAYYTLRIRNNESVNLVYTQVTQINILLQRMKYFTLSIAHITLQLSEQGNSSHHGGILKHVLLPVLT